MDLEHEITNYLNLHPKKSTTENVNFLIKLWNSGQLKSSAKYDAILKFFMTQVLSNLAGNEIEESAVDIQRFLKLKHPPQSVTTEVKKELVKKFSEILKNNSSENVVKCCLELASHEGLKDFYKHHLGIYSKFLQAIIKNSSTPENLTDAITELYCFANVEEFKKMFLNSILVPLDTVTKDSTQEVKTAKCDLLKTIFFSHVALSEPSLDAFEQELSKEQQEILMETFVVINKLKPGQVVRLVEFIYNRVLENCDDETEFLTQTKQILLLMQSQGIDLAPMKRLNVELFEKISTRVQRAIESSKQSMDFALFLDTLTSFINCDAFLFETNIYELLLECMLKEKSANEMENYEKLLSVVVKIYGKDLNQFLKKLLKSINDKLDNFIIPKKRKRKLLSGSDGSTTKKQKLSNSEAVTGAETTQIAHFWPKSMSEQFAEIVARLNVAQSIKIWNQLNNFLCETLRKLKASMTIDENVLLKIDFTSNLLSDLFLNTRLLEQLMYKRDEISTAAKNFNETQDLFFDIILNIEYNSRVMSAFLKTLRSYESFLMLFFYHHNADMKSELEQFFIGNQSRMKNEKLQIIQQRIKNFGKIGEKNQLNSLMIQQDQKNQLFDVTDASKLSDDLTILSDDEQIEFLLQNPDTRNFFVTSLEGKGLTSFVQFLVKLDQKQLQSTVLQIIALKPELLNAFVAEVLKIDDETQFESSLNVLGQLPLSSISEDNKKLVFGELLEKRFKVDMKDVSGTVVTKLFDNDSYKAVLKDFTMKKIFKSFEDTETFSQVYQAILSNAVRKLNPETMGSLEWILKSDDNNLLFITAKVLTEIPLTPIGGVTGDALKKLKTDLVAILLTNAKKISSKNLTTQDCEEFFILAKLFSENSSSLKDDVKAEFNDFLQNNIKSIVKSPNVERVKLLLMILKDAKKFNLNDEMKGTIVDCLLAYLNSMIVEQKLMTQEVDKDLDVELETQIFATLKPFKSNFQESCVENLRKALMKSSKLTDCQLQYSFKIYQVALKSTEKTASGVVRSFLKFLDECVTKALIFKSSAVLIEILTTNNAILGDPKIQLENTAIDELLCLLIDPRIKPSTFGIEDFSKFYGAVGETLFVIASIRQNYFKSRISQFFNIYKSFIDAIYFYKNDQPDELEPVETSLLLKLTLQLENIINMVVKNHSLSIKIISLYVASSIISIFVKNPKTLSNGNKFKMNIKNICYQLLSTMDDKTRKHIYSVADETTREVYDGLFREIKR